MDEEFLPDYHFSQGARIVRYEILGPLRVADNDSYRSITARKIEAVLAALIIRSDQIVTPAELMVEIWAEDLPLRATAGLHVYISQLRKFLHRPDRAENPIVTRPPGYILRMGNDEVDFHVFSQLINQGRTQVKQHRFAAASELFEEALGLWRGPVLSGLGNGPIITGFVTRMMEARLECLELLADAHLELGYHRELVGRLYSLIAEHPLCEAFYRQLMIALYRSERQADALKVYQAARTTLNDELGLEPGRALRELQHAILTTDDRVDIAISW